MKKILIVTGCSGRIGSRVTAKFADEFQVVGFDTVPPRDPPPGMEYLPVDLGQDASVEKGFDTVREKFGDEIASVIHLAAYYSFSGGSTDLYDNITVRGTGRVLEAAKKFKCEQFVFSSTQLVHAPCDVHEKINEDSLVEAKWDYPLSKIKTEELLHKEHGDIPVVILRIAGCYDDECHSIPISNHIQRIYEKQLASRLFPGDTTHGAPFLHLDDLVDAIDKAVHKRHELPPELTLIIGEDRTLSYEELQNKISNLLFKEDLPIHHIPKWFAKMGAWAQDHTPGMEESFIKPWMIDLADDNYILDITKAKETIGWTPQHFVGDTLPIMIKNLQDDPLHWYKINGLRAPEWLKKKLQGAQV